MHEFTSSKNFFSYTTYNYFTWAYMMIDIYAIFVAMLAKAFVVINVN